MAMFNYLPFGVGKCRELNAKKLVVGGDPLNGTAGTDVTAKMVVLNGVTATAAELNHCDGKATQVSFVIGTEGSNARAVQMTFKDANGVAIAYPAVHKIYLSDAATGIGITADVLTTTFAIATNGSILNVADVTGKMGTFQTSAAGLLGLTLTQTATKNYYLVVILGDGSLAVSTIIAFD